MDQKRSRWILHSDADCFYAAIEQRDRGLYGKPVIIGGIEGRGVVATCSYEARKFNIRSAMSMVEAKKRCQHGIFLPPDMGKYAQVSNQIRQIYDSFSPLVEPLSLDECFMDLTGTELLYSKGVEDIARKIKERIKNEIAITVSVGVSHNKFLAKLASDLKKPDGLIIIRPGEEIALLAPMPITKLWGVGEATARILKGINVVTIADLRKVDIGILERYLGKSGPELYNLAWGKDDRPVVPDREAKSIGNENTFLQDIWSKEAIEVELLALSERIGWRLRRAGISGRTVTVKVRYSSFKTITRSLTLQNPINFDEVIYEIAKRIMEKVPITEGIRLLGITVSHLGAGCGEMDLFDEVNEKREKLTAAVDKLKGRFGSSILKHGRLLEQKNK
jgi:DNA polymerase IV